jgi:hypothetical protein
MATIPPLKIEIGDGLLLWNMKKKWNFGWWNPPVFHGYPNQIVDEEYGKPQKATLAERLHKNPPIRGPI